MSVHLVGRNYGVVPGAAEVVGLDPGTASAVERAASDSFQRVVWIPAGLETDDDRRRAFLRSYAPTRPCTAAPGCWSRLWRT
jgi:hypothetical protein